MKENSQNVEVASTWVTDLGKGLQNDYQTFRSQGQFSYTNVVVHYTILYGFQNECSMILYYWFFRARCRKKLLPKLMKLKFPKYSVGSPKPVSIVWFFSLNIFFKRKTLTINVCIWMLHVLIWYLFFHLKHVEENFEEQRKASFTLSGKIDSVRSITHQWLNLITLTEIKNQSSIFKEKKHFSNICIRQLLLRRELCEGSFVLVNIKWSIFNEMQHLHVFLVK